MTCSNCGLYISDPNASLCPRCGQTLPGRAYEYPGSSGVGPDAFSSSPTQISSRPAPPDAGRFSEYAEFGSPSQSAPPGYPPMPSAPGYPPMSPATGSAPLAPVSPPPRKSKGGLIIGLLLVLVLVLVGGLGVSLYALNARNHQQQTQSGSSTPTPQGTVLFQDPLTSNANGWANDSHCFFQGGSYHVKDGYVCYVPAGNLGDANISVKVKQIAGLLLVPYGIAFRLTPNIGWYEFDIDSNSKWVFFEHHYGDVSELAPYTPNAAIKGGLNTTNTLMVQAKGSHFTLFVNGTKVGEVDDNTFASGLSGLNAGGSIEVAYNNLQITTAS